MTQVAKNSNSLFSRQIAFGPTRRPQRDAMSTKSALKKKSRASLIEEAPKRKSEGSDDERENIDSAPAVVDKKMKKKKADTVSEALTELPENVARTQDKKVALRHHPISSADRVLQTAEKVPRSLSVAAGIDLQAVCHHLKLEMF